MPYNYGNYYGNGNWWNYPQNQIAPQYSQMPVQQYQQQNVNTNTFAWVQGEAGAKAYHVDPGQSVLLMDSENAVLYMKSADAAGRPLPIEAYDLVKRVSEPLQISTSPASVTKEDLMQYVKVSDLEAKVKELVDKALET